MRPRRARSLAAFATIAALAACRTSAGDPTGGGGTGACGGVVCGEGEYCNAPPCGEGQDECLPAPASCDGGGTPVCGDDGKVYPSTCAAEQAGRSLGRGCATPAGAFACGAYFCDPSTQYCETAESTCGPSMLACQTYPSYCTVLPPPNCDCLGGTVACEEGDRTASTCTQAGDHFSVYCPQ